MKPQFTLAGRNSRIRAFALILTLLLTACAGLRPADPELRVAQTFDAFLSQLNETTDFYDALYRQRLVSQGEYDRFVTVRRGAQPTVDALYAAYKAGSQVESREDFRRVRRDLELYILKYLATKKGAR